MTDNRNNYLLFENRNRLYTEDVLTRNPAPVAGEFYTVPQGGWIDTISVRAYGYDRSSDIVAANDLLLRNRVLVQGLPTIHPNDVLWLPPLTQDTDPNTDTIASSSPDEVTIRINGKLFYGWTITSAERSMNNIADAFTFVAPYDPDDEFSRYLDPYTYHPADLFIGGNLYIAGRCEKWKVSYSGDSTKMSIECRSKAGVIVDCPSQERSLSFTNQTLSQIANIMLIPFGLLTDFPNGDTGIITKSKRNITEKIYEYFSKLAKGSGLTINSSKDGKVVFESANVDGIPIMTLVQGQQPLTGLSAEYDGTQRFSHYQAISQSRGNSGNTAIEQDESIPVFRPTIFDAKDTQAGNIEEAARWEKSKALAKSAKSGSTVGGWFDDNNDIIMENNIVTLYAPKVCIFNESRFLIEKVSLSGGENSKVAKLTLVTPESYTRDFPSRFWWSR